MKQQPKCDCIQLLDPGKRAGCGGFAELGIWRHGGPVRCPKQTDAARGILRIGRDTALSALDRVVAPLSDEFSGQHHTRETDLIATLAICEGESAKRRRSLA